MSGLLIQFTAYRSIALNARTSFKHNFKFASSSFSHVQRTTYNDNISRMDYNTGKSLHPSAHLQNSLRSVTHTAQLSWPFVAAVNL